MMMISARIPLRLVGRIEASLSRFQIVKLRQKKIPGPFCLPCPSIYINQKKGDKFL